MSCIAFVNEREACLRFIAARRLLLKALFYSLSLVRARAFGRRVFVAGINNSGVTLCRSRVQSAYYASRSKIGILRGRGGGGKKEKVKRATETRRLKSSVGQSQAPSIFFSFFLSFPPRTWARFPKCDALFVWTVAVRDKAGNVSEIDVHPYLLANLTFEIQDISSSRTISRVSQHELNLTPNSVDIQWIFLDVHRNVKYVLFKISDYLLIIKNITFKIIFSYLRVRRKCMNF